MHSLFLWINKYKISYFILNTQRQFAIATLQNRKDYSTCNLHKMYVYLCKSGSITLMLFFPLVFICHSPLVPWLTNHILITSSSLLPPSSVMPLSDHQASCCYPPWHHVYYDSGIHHFWKGISLVMNNVSSNCSSSFYWNRKYLRNSIHTT